MNDDATSFYTPTKTPVWSYPLLAGTFRVAVRKVRVCTRVAAVFLFGCFVLSSFVALQVAALELSDRLDVFPLYGFFFINLICGLFLSWFIARSREHTSLRDQEVVGVASAYRRRFARLWPSVMGALKTRRAKALRQEKRKRVAVLLIIKRQASVESKQKSHAAAA